MAPGGQQNPRPHLVPAQDSRGPHQEPGAAGRARQHTGASPFLSHPAVTSQALSNHLSSAFHSHQAENLALLPREPWTDQVRPAEARWVLVSVEGRSVKHKGRGPFGTRDVGSSPPRSHLHPASSREAQTGLRINKMQQAEIQSR